ncbi:MAG: NDP-sugar synthase [Mangrovibacterium sp.]
MKPTLLILAAGMGSRYGGLKQIDPFGPNGEAIIEYSVFDAIRAGFGKVVFVIRESFADEFKAKFDGKLDGKIEVEYVYQEINKLPEGYTYPEGREKPWGTGHAILMAKDVIKEPFASINADDFYGKESFEVMADFLKNECTEDQYSMMGYSLKNTLSEYGSVSRGICESDEDKNLTVIVERHDIRREAQGIVCDNGNGELISIAENSPASMNYWGFHPSLFGKLEELFKEFLDADINTPKSEFYIPNVVFDLIKSKEAATKVLEADSPWFGVTFPKDKPFVVGKIKDLTDKGIYPAKLW